METIFGVSHGRSSPSGQANNPISSSGNGQAVISRLDETTLAEIARTAGGRYFRATAAEGEVGELGRVIDDMEKKELQSRMVRRYLERYQLPLLLAVICLVAEGLLLDRRHSLRRLLANLFQRGRGKETGKGESVSG